jgi:polyribonucleotide nucleotidyltransferase
MMNQKTFTTTFAGKELSISIGGIAQAANGAVTVRMGDTIVLVTAVMNKHEVPGMGYFPLMVEYEERLYAGGRIKGSRFIKREGRPSDEAVLIGRFIDRAIRPLFDDRSRHEVQVIATTLSFDEENDPDVLALIGASCALHMSSIPWNGPIAAIRVSQNETGLVFNPTYQERATTHFDLDIAGTPEKVVMVEARAKEASDVDVVKAFEAGTKELAPVIALIEKIRAEVGKEKIDIFKPKNEAAQEKAIRKAGFVELARTVVEKNMDELFYAEPLATKGERVYAKSELERRVAIELTAQGAAPEEISDIAKQIYDFIQIEVSNRILKNGQRLDGRDAFTVRPLQIEVGVLPRVHGTGLFSRGETQVLSVCTLGAPGDEQTLDSLESVGEKRYMHHYNFPPFSVGESKPMRGPGRREIGHGALAEKAVEDMMPDKETFPYAVRVVSEVLNSNGSSSMASTCASTLALMDAGVPLKTAVAGIAIGLASNEKGDWKVITDIQDLEDGPGGMDFKITGTVNGITAIQMDTKTKGLSHDIIVEAIRQGNAARQDILKQMKAIIAAPRAELSPFAPRILKLRINPDKIRDVIGPGGKMINEIIAKTGVVAIDMEQDGLVMITAKSQEAGQKAYDWVNNLTREVQAGEVFHGSVVRIMDFGAFVNILPGKDGMVHVSELAPWRVNKVEDIVKVGDEVHVKVIAIDDMGRVNLSMKQATGNVYPEAPANAVPSVGREEGSRPPRKPFSKPRSH